MYKKAICWIIAALILLTVAVCLALPGLLPRNEDYYYVPEREWSGLETRAYDELYGLYVSSFETGSPDPEYDSMAPVNVDMSQILFISQKEQYSLREDAKIALLAENTSAETLNASIMLNLEQWDGTRWNRMIMSRTFAVLSEESLEFDLSSGENWACEIEFADVITVLTPGKYRAVAYINYEPVYAEFELVE